MSIGILVRPRGSPAIVFAAVCFSCLAPAYGDDVSGLDGAVGSFDETLATLRETEFQTVAESNERARFSVEDIRNEILNRHARLHSIEFDLVVRIDPRLGTGESPGAPLRQSSFRVEMALKDRRIVERRWPTVFESPGLSAKKFEPVVNIFDGSRTAAYDPRYRAMTIEAAEARSAHDAVRVYFTNLMMFLSKQPDLELDIRRPLPRFLDLKRATVLPRLEKVDEHLCHVIACADSAAWIDHLNGFALRRLVMFRRAALDEPPCLSLLTVCNDFENVGEGIWLPKTIHSVKYTSQSSPPGRRGKVSIVNSMLVNRVAFNKVDDSRFRIDPPPGIQVNDAILKKTYTMPRGIDLLDKAISEGRALDPSGQPYGLPEKASLANGVNFNWWRVVFLLLSAAAFIYCAVALIIKKWRAGHST